MTEKKYIIVKLLLIHNSTAQNLKSYYLIHFLENKVEIMKTFKKLLIFFYFLNLLT